MIKFGRDWSKQYQDPSFAVHLRYIMTGGIDAAHLTILHEIQNAILTLAQDAASTNQSQ
ncbi:hypothetical protein [Acinetobacter junii]|uniref:hypothetical protein n=1 Tax=Acinetobacter junii TaxID=40215 RepID=UPI003AF8353D